MGVLILGASLFRVHIWAGVASAVKKQLDFWLSRVLSAARHLCLDPPSTQTKRRKHLKTAQRAIIVHIFRVQVLTSRYRSHGDIARPALLPPFNARPSRSRRSVLALCCATTSMLLSDIWVPWTERSHSLRSRSGLL